MKNPASRTIDKSDIKKYLNNYSDFSFEIKVLEKLGSLGFNCQHSGLYEDPVTKKTVRKTRLVKRVKSLFLGW
jgi:hypothetical protein